MRIFLFVAFLGLSMNTIGQSIISGYVLDKSTKEPLISAAIYDTTHQEGVVTNEYGYYRIKIFPNSVLQCSYLNYKTYYIDSFIKDSLVNFYLDVSVDLDEIVIIDKNTSIEFSRPGIVNLPIDQLKAIPSVGGEKDILKAITILPGMSNGSEGSSSLLVRGGGQDQNLYILDGAPVYNTGHLLNFISVFNPDALKKVYFYKGGMPAKYGGRLSSVVDVNFKDGNKNQKAGVFDLGLINSKYSLEGPIGKSGKTSYLATGRATYLDFIQSLAGNSARKVKTFRKQQFTGYTFYDLNFKINHDWNQKSKIFFSYYEGRDRLRIIEQIRDLDDNKITVANRSATLKYFNILNSKSSFSTILNYTQNKGMNQYIQKYNFGGFSGRDATITDVINSRKNKLEDFSLFLHWDHSLSNSHFLRAGIQSTYHIYKPNLSQQFLKESFTINDSLKFSTNQEYASPTLKVPEVGLHMSDEVHFNKNISADLGIRNSYFFSNEKTYSSIEPRVAIKYSIPNLFTLNATFSKNVQYSHALQSNEIGFERLIWVPSGKNIIPQSAVQYSVGIVKSFGTAGYDVSFEAYTKKMKGLSQFVYYYDFGDNIYQNWDQNILTDGIGSSKGLEFLVNKTKGKLTGLVSYTLSKTDRQFTGFNKDRTFPFKYDRRHILNLFCSYQLTSKWKIGALFNYSTGFKFTPPTGKLIDVPIFDIGSFINNEQYLYESVNSAKMPDYHRLDLNASHEKIREDGKISTWSINIYNAYNRLNPLFIYIKKGSTFGTPPKVTPTAVKAISLLPILPSINYSIKF